MMTRAPGAGHACRHTARSASARAGAAGLRAIAVGTIVLNSFCPGCGWDPYRTTPGSTHADDPTPATAAEALSPKALVISPLTSIRRSEAAQDQLIVHFALHDGFGQPVKALGTAVIELTRPAAHANDGTPLPTGDDTTRWQVDLRDPEANAEAFDGLVTKTYALRLGGLPGGESAPTGGWAVIKATFTVVDAGWGESRVLTAEARVAW